MRLELPIYRAHQHPSEIWTFDLWDGGGPFDEGLALAAPPPVGADVGVLDGLISEVSVVALDIRPGRRPEYVVTMSPESLTADEYDRVVPRLVSAGWRREEP